MGLFLDKRFYKIGLFAYCKNWETLVDLIRQSWTKSYTRTLFTKGVKTEKDLEEGIIKNCQEPAIAASDC